jgi:hypothetical protein
MPTSGDKEASVSLHFLDKFPTNVKKDIHGIYKRGLKASLEYFDLCDRLKVWPNPTRRSRYLVLNGNQRLDLIIEIRVNNLFAAHFGLSLDESGQLPARDLTQLRTENPDLLKKFTNQVMKTEVDVLILSRLDADDAALFNAVFDRNHATPDEAKIVAACEAVTSKPRALIKIMARPDIAFVQPKPPPAVPFSGSNPQLPPIDPSSHSTPDLSDVPDDPRYGQAPPAPSRPPQPALIPLVLSLTPDGHKEIMSSVLRLNARLPRERKIIQALQELEQSITKRGKTFSMDDITLEIALLTISRHAVLAAE